MSVRDRENTLELLQFYLTYTTLESVLKCRFGIVKAEIEPETLLF